jgi:DNA-binding winged helix-turn-helix (wHTH) protein/tetratricopeptide (TPR) repeat protein
MRGGTVKYRFAGCELDMEARTLRVEDRPVHVERQVFEILALLAENAGRAVSRELLLARVWDGRVVSESAIASRINAARRAVGDDGRRQAVIATESRFGFRLVAEIAVEGGTEGRPAIAVLPLDVIGGTDGDVHLARGIADQLAGMLGYASHVDVIDTAASFAPSLASLAPAKIAASLAVRYLVVGSLHLSGDALRVQLRLVESEHGRQVWARTFEGAREQVFDLQDRLASAVLGEIEPHLVRHEIQLSRTRHGTVRAFDHYLRAADLLRRMDRDTIQEARSELDKAIAQYPRYAAAYSMKAWIATLMVPNGLDVDPDRERATAERGLTLGPLDCDALSMGGYAYGFFSRDPEAGLDHVTRALALNPSSARAHDHAGWLLLYTGRCDEAATQFDRAVALCPLDEFSFRMLTGRAFADLFRRDFTSAVSLARRARAASPGYTISHRVLIAALAHLGRDAEARAIAADLLDLNPKLTLARYAAETRFADPGNLEILLSGLARAGLP